MSVLFTVRIDICGTQLHLRAAVSRSEYEQPHRAGPGRAAPHRGSNVAHRVTLRARVRFMHVLPSTQCAREDNKYNYYKPAGTARSQNAPPHERPRRNSCMREDNIPRVIIKGRGRKLHIYLDHHLSSILQRCIENATDLYVIHVVNRTICYKQNAGMALHGADLR